ncbi:MAG: hypothetical protein IT204_11025 [Fimbriimonadaceae bacterium]|nr:hypothetical protein [Fimbriimonadaceae bacterium]
MPELAPWPVLTSYDQDHQTCVALPLGGIGTGTIALGGRGELRDFEVGNRPAKGYTPGPSFFALWARPTGGTAVARGLEGVLQPPYEGASGARQPNHGLPRFRHCRYDAAYPLAQVHLSDPEVPLEVTLQAHNPLVPADVAASSWPVAQLRWRLHNPGSVAVSASVAGSLPNFIGRDGSASAAVGNRNEFRRGLRVQGVVLSAPELSPWDERWGTLALVTTAARGVSYRTAWAQLGWGDTLLDWWDDFLDDGRLEERDGGSSPDPRASLAVQVKVPPGATREVTFVLAWHFPNRQTWTRTPADQACCADGACENSPDRIGNYYTTLWRDAWEAAEQYAGQAADLEARTVRFVRSFVEQDLPAAVKEAALYNLSTLRSQTCFRTPDGRFYGFEGCHDQAGCCHGSCTHVWNYEQATAFVFGDLARRLREVEFAHCTDAAGRMSFRVNLPLERAQQFAHAAADGQMGCLLKLHREWRLSGDDGFLRALWPAARRALEFCWVPGGWDADQDGVMEGCQHNTMDVEYYGPNPQMTGWYLGALRAAEELARHLGELDFAERCADLFRRGSAWMDEHLFNGEYYEQEVRPIADPAAIAAGLRVGMGAADLTNPELQLGAGCLIDQLVGQFQAQVCGLGHLHDPAKVATCLQSIVRHNRRADLYGHFNHLRSYALADESAVLMASYPRGRRPRRPFPYFTEVMTGFEYTLAVGLLQEGLTQLGLELITAIRARYDGRRRNPFDEAECGHHYARAMASWGAVLALTGFDWEGGPGRLTFAAPVQPTTWSWSTGDAWGTVQLEPRDGQQAVTLTVAGGELRLRELRLRGWGAVVLPHARRLRGTLELLVEREA